MAESPRDRLLGAATKLFYRDGFHAVGIDRILREAGVAKMTLYSHFASKDALIAETLRRRARQFETDFEREVMATASPRRRLLAVFEALDAWIGSAEFQGCMFVAAAAEFHEADHPARVAAAEHKRAMRAFLLRLAKDAEAKDAETLAARLALLVEGTIALAHVAGDREAATRAQATAELILHDAFAA